MADVSPQRSDEEEKNSIADGDGGQGQTQQSSNPPSRSSSITSANSNASKSSHRKETNVPEVHRTTPPATLSVRTSKYDNTYDITYDDIPLNESALHQEHQQPEAPPGQAPPKAGTPSHVYTPQVSASKFSNEPGIIKIDLSDRDPTHMNDDVKVEFDDLFAEPDGYHSIDCVWVNSSVVFTKTKFWCYRILTAIFAIPCAFCWGISFACLTCGFVWNVRPMIRRYAIEIIPYAKIWRIFIEAVVSPVFEACGRIFSGITITMKKE
ncbi:caveolin-2-like [Ylistrum balloti]|uniref:caveolin-2-like n=1 Tax=Ylistrum balloti TaxID=509963 RepID=UPI002905A36D|nr:caveolin-2-like [Ylistrum balloti]